MKTQTYTLSQDIPTLTGEAHTQKIRIPRSATEITLDSVGPRIVVVLGNSRKRVGIILTPGSDP